MAFDLSKLKFFGRLDARSRVFVLLAGVIGFGAWWWSRQRNAVNRAAASDRGTVIFRNTPAPTPLSTEDVL